MAMYNLRFLMLMLLLSVTTCSRATDAEAPAISQASPLSQIPSQANTNSPTSQTGRRL
jgi:hypothetical protein